MKQLTILLFALLVAFFSFAQLNTKKVVFIIADGIPADFYESQKHFGKICLEI